ncbi:MAG: DUF3325 domain-containing protein [Candidatus Didemnitutus sp.]|nr:DUF3325 domain-containing protein [Candidatus Didemnitutus sp.]
MNPFASFLAYAGLASLALAMDRHHRAVFARDLAPHLRIALRAAGWVLLVASGGAAWQAHGAAIGAVAWLAGTASAGFTLTLLLTYRPRFWAAPLALLVLLACR